MEIENTEILKGFARSWSVAAKPCDSCKSAASAVFCRADSAFLCLTCDSKIHCTTKLALRHERVWMCEVCEQAPAAVTCKADAAALCVTCDSDIHSANPLASRHERVPVEPFLDSVDSIVNFSSAFNFGKETMGTCSSEHTEAASWNITNPNLIGANKLVDGHDHKSSNGGLFFNEMNSFLEFDYPNPICPNSGSDSVVPVKAKMNPLSSSINIQPHENCFELDFSSSKLSSFNYSTQSIHHSVSSSSLDVGIVPDGNSLSNISHHFCQNVNQTGSDPSVSTAASQASKLYGINREARVLRYREKRKKRKFEKTIRYASRKAYAETRPRIKGRFVKRTETETKVINGIYNSPSTAPFIIDTPYDVVSSFC